MADALGAARSWRPDTARGAARFRRLIIPVVLVLIGSLVWSSAPASAASASTNRSPGHYPIPSHRGTNTGRTPQNAAATPIAAGDVLVSDVNSGNVLEFTPAGAIVQTLSTGQSEVAGSAFDNSGNFFATNFGNGTTGSGAVTKFDASGNLVGTFGSGYNCDPESIVFDQSNHAFVGQADCTGQLLEFDSAGNPVASFSPAVEGRGTDWDALASDQCTMLYTSEGALVKAFNVCTNTQLADFASGLPGSFAYELRIRPNGEVLVADSQSIVRLSSSGTILQTYTIPGSTGNLFALNLDPNGTSFWTADLSTNGVVAEVDIATGNILNSWNSGSAVVPSGLTLKAGTPQPIGGPVVVHENPAGGNPSEPNACSSQGSAGDPCNTASGSVAETATDLQVPGRGIPLSFTRTYSSVFAGTSGRLGFGWTSNYVMSLSVDTPTGDVTVHQENGADVFFTPLGGGYTAPPRVIATLTKNLDGTFTFVREARNTFTFSAAGQLTTEHDLNGYITSFAYNATGQLTTVTDPASRHLAFAYTGSHLTSVTDPLGRVVSFAYSGSGDLQRVTDVAGGLTTFTYDSSHLLLTTTDPRGGVVTNVYDSSKRVTSQSDALVRKTTFAYSGNYISATGGSTTITDPAGNVTVEQYVYGERTSVTKGYGTSSAATTDYTYDPATLGITSVTDPNGHISTSIYDSNGNLLSRTDPLGRTTSSTYNSVNETLTVTDPKGVTTTTTHDAAGNLVTTSTPLNSTHTQTITNHYSDTAHPGDVTSVTNPDGKTTTYSYDTFGNRTSGRDPLSDKTAYAYNVIGWETSQTSPKGKVTTYTHDAFGQATLVVDPLGNKTTSSYDADQNLVSTTDATGHTTSYVYDLDNELTGTTQPDGTTLHTQYNPDGSIVAQANAAGAVTTYSYDPLQRVISITDALGRSTTSTYDLAGNLLTLTDAQGEVTTYTYDAADQQTSITYSDGTTPNVTGIAYDADGQRIKMTDGTGTSSWIYNPLHRLISSTNGTGLTVSCTYDLAGNLLTLTYPGSVKVTYTYDAANRMTSVKDWNSNKTSFKYDADSNLTKETLPTTSGIVDNSTYDSADRLASIIDMHGTSVLFKATYSRNSDNLLTADSSQPSAVKGYGYTPLNQLCYAGSTTNALCSSPPSGATVYTYNTASDLTRTGVTYQAFDAADELCWTAASTGSCGSSPTGATNYSYNLRGDRISATPGSGPATTLGYDQTNRLTSWSQGSISATYTYNGDGLRMSKTVGGATTSFSWSVVGSQSLLLQENTGSSLTRYVYGAGSQPVEQVTATGAQFLHHDQLGSTRIVTSPTGSVIAALRYDPYGNLTSTSGTASTPFLFGGQYRDAASGLYYLRARFYDPRTAQFLTRDPVVAVTMSPYAYVMGNPLNHIDPTGLDCSPNPLDWGSCVGDAANAALPVVHAIAGGVAAVASVCAIVTSETVIGGVTCGAIALGAAAVNAGTGDILYAQGRESGTNAVLDNAGLGLAGVGSIFEAGASAASTLSDIEGGISDLYGIAKSQSPWYSSWYRGLQSSWWGAKSALWGGAAGVLGGVSRGFAAGGFGLGLYQFLGCGG
jgi:RHS repeat-associated protein